MLLPGSSVLTIDQSKYHPDCFKCNRCSSPLQEYHKAGSEYLCKLCHTEQKLKSIRTLGLATTEDALNQMEELSKRLETETENSELIRIATVLKWIHEKRDALEMPPSIPLPETPSGGSATTKLEKMKNILRDIIESTKEFLTAIQKELSSNQPKTNSQVTMLIKGTQLVKQSLVPLQMD